MASPNSVPRYIELQTVAVAQVTTANANLDGTGAVVTVATAGTYGTFIRLIRVMATGTTTAGMVRLFVNDGANTRLIGEVPVSAIIPSGTVQAFTGEFTFSKDFVLPSGWTLRASTANTETFNVFVIGGTY